MGKPVYISYSRLSYSDAASQDQNSSWKLMCRKKSSTGSKRKWLFRLLL